MEKELYQKNGYAIKMISRDFLILEDGSRISSIEQYAAKLSVSRWVIQVALNFLAEQECVYYEKRGMKGTFVHHLDQSKLWKYADMYPLYGLLPFPTSKYLESLLTGISESFRAEDVPMLITYLPTCGGRFSRLEKDQCHFIVTSQLAAEIMIQQNPELEIAGVIDGAQYCEPFALMTHREDVTELKDGMTIAVNDNSVEQVYLADILKKKYRLNIIKGSYHDQLEWFRSKKLDYFLWRQDEDLYSDDVHGISLSDLGVDQNSTIPVILVKKSSCNMKEIIQRYFDLSEIGKIQGEVLSGKRPAKYL